MNKITITLILLLSFMVLSCTDIGTAAGSVEIESLLVTSSESDKDFGEIFYSGTPYFGERTTALTKIISIQNNGSENLDISSITSSDNQFSITSNTSMTLVPGANGDISISFFPTSSGTQTSYITIHYQECDNTQIFSVTGKGNRVVSGTDLRTSSGTWTSPNYSNLTADITIVGGGGGGAHKFFSALLYERYVSGGNGYITNLSEINLTSNVSYNITIGQGGGGAYTTESGLGALGGNGGTSEMLRTGFSYTADGGTGGSIGALIIIDSYTNGVGGSSHTYGKGGYGNANGGSGCIEIVYEGYEI